MKHRIGTVDNQEVFVEVKLEEAGSFIGGTRLGISAEIRRNGREDGGGQSFEAVRAVADHGTPAEGWTPEGILKFCNIWERWHLNDLRAGCEHQREWGWNKVPIDPAQPLDAYGRFFVGQTQDSWNMLAWVRRDEHEFGLLEYPCPVCGYKYGSAWLYEELPQDVIEFIKPLAVA